MDLHTKNLRLAKVIATERLRLRPLERSDLQWVCEVAGTYEVSKMLVPVPHPYSMQDAEEFFELERSGALGALWIIDADVPVGSISIGPTLGYWIDPEAWGNGYATEAATAAVAAFFEGTDADTAYSSHFVENDGSRRVLEKVGFLDVGPENHFSKARNELVPGRNMELTRDRWRRLRSGQQ